MRPIARIVIHCTRGSQDQSVQSILDYWKIKKGWKNPGYHYLIDKYGEVHNLLPIEKRSNGARGFNHDSIHISYIGGRYKNGAPIDNRTEAQKKSMLSKIAELRMKLGDISISVIGHWDLPNVKKACPSFDVNEWMKSIYD